MALLGGGALVIAHDIASGNEEDYGHWLSHEHFGERLGVPGFLRGRRYLARDARRGFFILYEVAEPMVLTSKPYLDRLNDPTPWSRRVIAAFVDTRRTVCAVRHSNGFGVGAALVAVEFSPAPGGEARLERWLADEIIEALPNRAGFTGAHWLVGDAAASQAPTAEKRLRGAEDAIADQVVLVEGYDEDAVKRVAEEALSPARLAERGAAPGARVGTYRLVHCVTRAELEADLRSSLDDTARGR